MRAVIQCVRKADVSVNGGEPRAIGPGIVILLGVKDTDTLDIVPKLAEDVYKRQGGGPLRPGHLRHAGRKRPAPCLLYTSMHSLRICRPSGGRGPRGSLHSKILWGRCV